MRYCSQCRRLTAGDPLYCNHCGATYDAKLCPARSPRAKSAAGRTYVHPRAEGSSQISSEATDLSTVSREIPARAKGVKHPAIVALTNGWLGYLVTETQYKAGKYEPTMSFYGPTIGAKILAGIKSGLEKYKD